MTEPRVDHLLDRNPRTVEERRRVHDGLVGLGYRAAPPDRGKATYVKYLDPQDDGRNLGYLDGARFYVSRGDQEARLAALPHWGTNGRHAYVQLGGTEALAALLDVARDLKAS